MRCRVWRRARSTHVVAFITLLFVLPAVAVLLPLLCAEAQEAGKVARVGFLSPSSLSDPRTRLFIEAFRQRLRALGWIEGQNIAIEYRWAEERTERLPDLASNLVSRRVDVLVAATSPAIQAAKQATVTIPIIMAGAVDPVATGFVASIARPGGNITGLSDMSSELVGKQLEILREVVPRVSHVDLLWNPTNPSNAPQLQHAHDASRASGLRLKPREARGPAEIDSAFAAMTSEGAGAVMVMMDAMFIAHRTRIAELATKSRLPAIYGRTDHVKAGGLMAYGPNIADLYRRAAAYVDKILKGSNPADLPVEQPTKFELLINLKTARGLGLTIPHSVLLRADEVIQ
jgi:putative ABC transport system substrate-binding protein